MYSTIEFMLTRLHGKSINNNLVLISRNRLITLYEKYGLGAEVEAGLEDLFINRVDRRTYQLVDGHYSKHNIASINRILFGKEFKEMTVVLDEISLGSTDYGKEIIAYYIRDTKIGFKEKDAERQCNLERLKVKLELAGIKPSSHFYDWGYSCSDIRELGYLRQDECIALNLYNNTGKIQNKALGNIYLDTRNLQNLHNVSINTLVQCKVHETMFNELDIGNIIMFKSLKMNGNKIKVDKARFICLGEVYDCEIEFNSLYKLDLYSDIRNSKIIINCSLTKDTFHFRDIEDRYIFLKNTKIVFKSGIDIQALTDLLDRIEIYSLLEFKLVIPKRLQGLCLYKLDKKYHKYLEFGSGD